MSVSRLNRIVSGPVMGGSYRNLSAAGTTVVKATPGCLLSVVVNKAVKSGTVTLYDSLTATGTKIATIACGSSLTQDQFSLTYNAWFTAGLTVVKSAADDITIVYR